MSAQENKQHLQRQGVDVGTRSAGNAWVPDRRALGASLQLLQDDLQTGGPTSGGGMAGDWQIRSSLRLACAAEG